MMDVERKLSVKNKEEKLNITIKEVSDDEGDMDGQKSPNSSN